MPNYRVKFKKVSTCVKDIEADNLEHLAQLLNENHEQQGKEVEAESINELVATVKNAPIEPIIII